MACCCCTVWLIGAIFVIYALLKLYIKLTTAWCRSQTCLVGKTIIVTGANTGIGYTSAVDFAKRGARVILACRNQNKAEEARDKIIKATRNNNVVVKLVDLTSLESVRNFAKDINATEERLDVLVNNAGIGFGPDEKTKDGFPVLMQVNHFSNFLLTLLLMGLLKKSAPSRIVNVSSAAANFARFFDVEKINEFGGVVYSYFNSKLCNILFTMELAKRLKGTGVTVYSLHPGAIATEIGRDMKWHMKIMFQILVQPFLKTAEEGAQTTVYAAVAQGIEEFSGEHFDRCRKVARYSKAAVPGLSEKLWNRTVKLLKLKPEDVKL